MEKLGRYQILGEIGRGGCGVVYRALDPAIGRTVAIKTIVGDGFGESAKERFRREARSAGSLSHPNIVTIHELSDTGEIMFIAMEFVDGQTLAEKMSEPKLPLGFVLSVIRSAADGLDFAHASHIVHRDVKPANFLITKQGHLKITDFGIAKILDSDINLTNTGMVIGTVQYMSPEQIAAKEVTGRSDQFSLAVVAYEMLTGQRPFQGNSWASVIHSIVSTEPPALNLYRTELGSEVTAVLRKALSKEPAARYATCRDFADALERSISLPTDERKAFAGTGPMLQSPRDAHWEETAIMNAPVTAAAPTRVTTPPAGQTRVTTPPAGQTRVMDVAGAHTNEKDAPAEPTVVLPPSPPRRSWAIPVATAAVIAIGLGAWVALRKDEAPRIAPPAASSAPPASQATPAPAAEVPAPKAAPVEVAQNNLPDNKPPENTLPDNKAPEIVPRAQVQKAPTPPPVKPQAHATPVLPQSAPVVNPPVVNTPVPVTAPPASNPVASPPAANPNPAATPTPQPLPVPQVARSVEPPSVVPPSPKVTPAVPVPSVNVPAAPRGPDPAELAAQKQTAELQAARKETADAVSRYQQAFEARDLAKLKAAWPGLGAGEQSSFQSFFKIARSIKLQVTPVGDPVVTPTGATALYHRSLSASDERRPLPTQDQTVKITFRKSGDQMLIEAIEAVGR